MSKMIPSIKKTLGSKKFKYGGYAIAVTLVGIAAVVLFNIGLTSLEENFDLKIDTSQNKKFTLTEQTKQVMSALEKDIYIYTTYTPGQEQDEIVEIINKIKALSGRIRVENHDPDLEPGFMQRFTEGGETVSAGSVIVSDAEGKLFRVLDTYDLYEVEYDSNYQPTVTQIKAESAITIAANYISIGYMPNVYIAEGHGELTIADLSAVNASMKDENFNLVSLNIAQEPEKPQPGDIIMFVSPKVDLTNEERDILKPLIEKGGRFYFLFDPQYMSEEKTPNFLSLLKLYDVGLQDGYVFEEDTKHMFMGGYPNFLVPDLQSHDVTNTVKDQNIPLVIPDAGALALPDSPPENSMTITSLAKTSDSSYLKKIEDLVNAQSEGDIARKDTDASGPFDVAACLEKTNGSDPADTAKIVVIYSSRYLEAVASPSYANMSMLINGAAWMRNADKEIYVRAKDVSDTSLTFKNAFEYWLVVVISALLVPVLMLAAGILVYLKRKHL